VAIRCTRPGERNSCKGPMSSYRCTRISNP
jgi:hypothetical protein